MIAPIIGSKFPLLNHLTSKYNTIFDTRNKCQKTMYLCIKWCAGASRGRREIKEALDGMPFTFYRVYTAYDNYTEKISENTANTHKTQDPSGILKNRMSSVFCIFAVFPCSMYNNFAMQHVYGICRYKCR